MQLTELLYQRVKELGAKGQIALRPGYVTVVSKASVLQSAILCALFSGGDDRSRLALDPKTPARIALGFVHSDKLPHRLVREVGGIRELHKFDAASRKFVLLTADEQEIASFLRQTCGLPPQQEYDFFVLGPGELPSRRSASGDGRKSDVARLEEELRITRDYEQAQDDLFRVSTRLNEIGGSAKLVAEAGTAAAAAEAELARSPWTAAQIGDLAARAKRAEHDAVRRDSQIEDIARKRERASEGPPGKPDPFWLSPWFNGGLFVGVAIDVVAALLGHPVLALLGLAPFAVALVAVLRFIQVDEDQKQLKRHLLDLKGEEQAVRRRFEEDQAVLRSAMKAAGVNAPGELVAILEQHNEAAMRCDQALARLEQVKQDASAGAAFAEAASLQEEKGRLEQRIAVQGFARALADVEADLRRARAPQAPRDPGTLAKDVLAAASGLLGGEPAHVVSEAAPRLGQFLAALTDKRLSGAKIDSSGQVYFTAPDGRTGTLTALPPPLRDLAYSALRLCLLEKVCAGRKVPVLVDDSFAGLDAAKQAVVAKMLKAIAAHAQVIHRIADAVPQGIADHVVQA